MTNTVTVPYSTSNPDVATGVAQFLSPVVVNLEALVVNGKQAHWHVRGETFLSVHELLDTVVAHAQAWSDLAAERIIALGLPVDARLQTVAEKTTTKKMTAGFRQSNETITEVVGQIDAILESVNTAITELDELDQTSQDVVVEIARGLEKDRWFLAAHISE